LRLPFGCPNIRQQPSGASLQIAGGINIVTNFDPTTFDPSTVIPYLNNNPIPVVDPADVKALWQLQKNLKAKYGQPVSIAIDTVATACSPGAVPWAVGYRLGMLTMLRMLWAGGRFELPAELLNNNPSDAVFKALATSPMNGIEPGSNLQGPPLDLQEFIKLIQKESEAEATAAARADPSGNG
jgi:hypothetical protein